MFCCPPQNCTIPETRQACFYTTVYVFSILFDQFLIASQRRSMKKNQFSIKISSISHIQQRGRRTQRESGCWTWNTTVHSALTRNKSPYKWWGTTRSEIQDDSKRWTNLTSIGFWELPKTKRPWTLEHLSQKNANAHSCKLIRTIP